MKGDHLGELELLILLAVLRRGTDAYGMTIRQELEQAGREASIGAVYASAARLETKGYLRSWESDPEPIRGGRARRHFEVTASGKRAIKQTVGAVSRLVEGTSFTLSSVR